MFRKICQTIANTSIPVPYPVFFVRNLIMIAAVFVAFYAACNEPSASSVLFLVMGVAVLVLIAKGK